MATRLAASAIGVGILAFAVGATLASLAARDAGTAAIEARFEEVRIARARALRNDDLALRAQVANLARSPSTADAIGRLSAARSAVDAPAAEVAEVRARLVERYRTGLFASLEAVGGPPLDLEALVPVDPAAVLLQARFFEPGTSSDASEPPLPDDPTEAWATVQREVGAGLVAAADRLGVDDLLLVDAAGDVVYSSAVAADFATDLRIGPHSGSALGNLVASYRTNPSEEPRATDVVAYVPAVDRAVRFTAAPVLDGDRLVGIVVVRSSAQRISDLLSQGGTWIDGGLGRTGDVYLVGPDRRLRSDPRPFVEDPDTYVADALASGALAESDVNRVRATGGAALVVVARGDLAERAASADGSVLEGLDHLGRRVLAAVDRVEVDGVDWVIVAKMDVAEARADVESVGQTISVVVAIGVVILVFGAVWWARRLTAPMRDLGDHLTTAATTDRLEALLEPVAVVDTGRRARTTRASEFSELHVRFAAMQSHLRRRRDAVAATEADRSALLRTLVPDAVARRVEAGDRDVVDRVAAASVVAVVLHGAEGRPGAAPAGASGATLPELIGAMDEAAHRSGLERIKLLGDVYVAVCGHEQPYPDHAPRALAFAREVRALVAGAAVGDPGGEVAPAIGIGAGPVLAGLSGSSSLVYDVWGDTVSEAYLLARRAAPGDIQVSTVVAQLLPEGALAAVSGAVVGDG